WIADSSRDESRAGLCAASTQRGFEALSLGVMSLTIELSGCDASPFHGRPASNASPLIWPAWQNARACATGLHQVPEPAPCLLPSLIPDRRCDFCAWLPS